VAYLATILGQIEGRLMGLTAARPKLHRSAFLRQLPGPETGSSTRFSAFTFIQKFIVSDELPLTWQSAAGILQEVLERGDVQCRFTMIATPTWLF
jgi:hypothetical protein